MADFIIGPNGQIIPNYNPAWLPQIMNDPAKEAMIKAYAQAAGVAEDFYTGAGAPTGFTLGSEGKLPAIAGNTLPKAPGTGFVFGQNTPGATIDDYIPPKLQQLAGPTLPGNTGEAAAREAVKGVRAGLNTGVVDDAAGLLSKIPGGELLGKLAGKVGPWAGKVAGPVGLLSMIPSYLNERETAAPVNPNGSPFEQLLGTALGADNPNYSELGNAALHLNPISALGISGAGALKELGGLGEKLYDYAATPVKDKPNPSPQTMPNVVEAWAEMMQNSPQKQDAGSGLGGNSVEIGQADPRLAVPQMAVPPGVNLDEARKWMEQAAPKSTLDEEGTVRNKMLGALGEVLLQDNSALPTGQLLGRLGGGLLVGKVAGEESVKEQKNKDIAAQRDYALFRAGNAVDFAKLDAGHQNAIAETAFKNAMLKHQDAINAIEKSSPKFLGMQGGTAVYQTQTPDGKVKLNSFDTGALQRQTMAKVGLGGSGKSAEVLHDLTAADLQPMNDPFGYAAMISSELMNKGMLSSALGEKTFKTLNDAAQNQAMLAPGNDESRAKLYQQLLMGNAAGILLNNPELVKQVSPYSVFARGLTAVMEKRNGK